VAGFKLFYILLLSENRDLISILKVKVLIANILQALNKGGKLQALE
jgi:hypothetical protein